VLNITEVQVVHDPFDGLSAPFDLFKAPETVFRKSILQDISLKQGECGPEDRYIANREGESSFAADPTFEIDSVAVVPRSKLGFHALRNFHESPRPFADLTAPQAGPF
jgi:hypothetical protein